MGYLDGVTGTGVFKTFTLGAAAAAGAEAGASSDEVPKGVSGMIAAHDVVIFSSSSCPFCQRAIAALQEKGIEFTVIDATPSIRDELFTLTGKTSVPSGWVKGVYIGGCNDGPEDWMGILPCLNSGKIAELLK